MSSKSLIYWPATTIEIETIDNQTSIRIKYKMFWLYASIYMLMAIPFFASLAINIIDRSLLKGGGLEVLLVFLAFFHPVASVWKMASKKYN